MHDHVFVMQNVAFCESICCIQDHNWKKFCVQFVSLVVTLWDYEGLFGYGSTSSTGFGTTIDFFRAEVYVRFLAGPMQNRKKCFNENTCFTKYR